MGLLIPPVFAWPVSQDCQRICHQLTMSKTAANAWKSQPARFMSPSILILKWTNAIRWHQTAAMIRSDLDQAAGFLNFSSDRSNTVLIFCVIKFSKLHLSHHGGVLLTTNQIIILNILEYDRPDLDHTFILKYVVIYENKIKYRLCQCNMYAYKMYILSECIPSLPTE